LNRSPGWVSSALGGECRRQGPAAFPPDTQWNCTACPSLITPIPKRVDCLLRNAELRDAIEPYLDEAIFEIDFRLLPTAVENRFLESMLAWEQAPLVPIARWFDPPLAMQPACTLDDEQVHERLWQVIERLYAKRVVLESHRPSSPIVSSTRSCGATSCRQP